MSQTPDIFFPSGLGGFVKLWLGFSWLGFLLSPCFISLAPPCYMDSIAEDHRLESPTTPLLEDTDGSQDSPIFMYAPEFRFMPPPTYSEVRIVIYHYICPKPFIGS